MDGRNKVNIFKSSRTSLSRGKKQSNLRIRSNERESTEKKFKLWQTILNHVKHFHIVALGITITS